MNALAKETPLHKRSEGAAMNDLQPPESKLADLIKGLIGQRVKARIGIKQWQGRKINVVEYYLQPVPKELAKLLLASWEAWLSENPCPPDEPAALTINLWIPKAVSACLFRKLPPVRAADLIRHAMTRREKGPREVERTVERIYGGSLAGSPKPRIELDPYNHEQLAYIASHVPFEVTTDWLAEGSPECVLDVSPAKFLDTLFQPEERIAVMMEKWDKGFIYRPQDAKCAERLHNYVRLGSEGAWYLSNSVTGTEINGSYRSEANITDFRHLLIESDKAPKDLWLAMIVQLHAPILALYESGGRSVHAIVRVNATSKAEFDEIADNYRRQLVPLGADPNSGKAVQPTRLPGVVRKDNGKLQRLLYLNPYAEDDTPIYKRQDPEALTSRSCAERAFAGNQPTNARVLHE